MTLALAVSSPSFSRHPVLRGEAVEHFPRARFNLAGERLADAALAAFLDGSEAAIVGLERIDRALLAQCPSLRMVAKYGVGLDNIDVAACAERQVRVGWRPGVNAGAVAEMVLALAIGFRRNLFREARNMAAGVWNKDGGFGLAETRIGIVGLGHVGRCLAILLRGFDAEVLATDILDIAPWCRDHGVHPVTLGRLLAESDLVTLHVPLTPETCGLVDGAFLARMRPGAVLINTSRGAVVDAAALRDALDRGGIAGAALDVFEVEPPTDRAFLAHPRLIATPHIAGNSNEAILAMGRAAIEAMVDLAAGGEGIGA